jgi:segregation and condensation protein A
MEIKKDRTFIAISSFLFYFSGLRIALLLSENQKKTLVYTSNTPTFSLDNFEGPLELLLYLIQTDEMDVCSITIKKLTAQFMQALEVTPEVEISSETLALAATLLLMKSQKLLPQEESASELEEDPRVEMIQSLIEYCRFKETAKELSLREEEQKGIFPRATPFFRKELGSGLEEVGIDNLKNLLVEMLKRSAQFPLQIIKEDEWQISHKLAWLQQEFTQHTRILFTSLFAHIKSRVEMIVLFLALLEMMKLQEVRVVRESEKIYVIKVHDDSRT